MSQTHDEIRALRVMVDELRAEPPPELSWDAVEQRLLSRIGGRWIEPSGVASSASTAEARDPSPIDLASARARAHTRTTSPLMRVFGFAAAAAVLALGVGSMTSNSALPSAAAPVRHVVEATQVAAAPGNAGARDLSTLRPGDVVEAGDAPVSFAQAGLAQWTLAPGSTVRVRSVGVGHTVVLERGSLRAEVTPRDPSEGLVEAFAVEVGGTRVAVHGTAFSVTIVDGASAIEGKRVVVDVEHGAVAVGPVGYAGATTGHLLVGPSRASFSLDGGRSARLMERVDAPVVVAAAREPAPLVPQAPAPSVEDVPEHPVASVIAVAPRPSLAAHAPANPVLEPAAVESAPPVAVPEVAAAALPPLTAAVVQSRLARCLKHDPAADPTAVRVSVSSRLHITINADGGTAAKNTPTLRGDILNCVGGAIAGRYGGTVRELDVPITFQP